ncbi:MAG: acylphosphatase [Chlamydiae bacterium]|nr:acylphosphatase [Chlamydiota bacterium]
MITVEALFQGKVQNVGFRATIRRYALHYHLKGYVTNQKDGSVIVLVQGLESSVDDFFASIKNYPRGARIKESVLKSVSDKEIFSNFAIRPEFS